MLSVLNIIKGWTNYLTQDIDVEILAAARAEKCMICPKRKEQYLLTWFGNDIKDVNTSVCTGCGCPLAAKLRVKTETCPLNSWKE